MEELLKNEKNNKQTISEAMEVYKKALKALEEYNPALVKFLFELGFEIYISFVFNAVEISCHRPCLNRDFSDGSHF